MSQRAARASKRGRQEAEAERLRDPPSEADAILEQAQEEEDLQEVAHGLALDAISSDSDEDSGDDEDDDDAEEMDEEEPGSGGGSGTSHAPAGATQLQEWQLQMDDMIDGLHGEESTETLLEMNLRMAHLVSAKLGYLFAGISDGLEKNTELLQQVLRAGTKGGGGGVVVVNAGQIYIVDTKEKIADVSARARQHIRELVHPTAMFVLAEADMVVAKLVPGAKTISDAQTKALDYHKARKLVVKQAAYERQQVSSRAGTALNSIIDQLSAKKKKKILDAYLEDYNRNVISKKMLPCVVMAVLNKGRGTADDQDLQDGRFTLPAAATAYALDAILAKMRGEKMPEASTLVTFNDRQVAYSDMLAQRTTALRATTQHKITWAAPAGDE